MADKLTLKERSHNMSKIKGSDTSIEIIFRTELYKKGIRYRLRYPLYGKPDLAIPSIKTAIFINGCFWHQHKNCKMAYMPKTNIKFWQKKLKGNVERDQKVDGKLYRQGWKVIRVWECQIEKNLDKTVLSIIENTRHNSS